MRYSVEFNDGNGWHLIQSNIGNTITANQIVATLSNEYPDYLFRIAAQELVAF
jgi:uncharacterized phage-like protein YoqJ